MIYPTLPVRVFVKSGENAYAEPVFKRKPGEKVCPVRLSFTNETTTVRTDSAGSKGHAREDAAQVVLLAVPTTQIRVESRIEVLGKTLRVTGVHPRFTVTGALDHYELHCSVWG